MGLDPVKRQLGPIQRRKYKFDKWGSLNGFPIFHWTKDDPIPWWFVRGPEGWLNNPVYSACLRCGWIDHVMNWTIVHHHHIWTHRHIQMQIRLIELVKKYGEGVLSAQDLDVFESRKRRF